MNREGKHPGKGACAKLVMTREPGRQRIAHFMKISFPSEEEHEQQQRDRSPGLATRTPHAFPPLGSGLRGQHQRRLQLRGSNGFSPFSRTSRCNLRGNSIASKKHRERSPASQRRRKGPRWASGRSPDFRLSEPSAFPELSSGICSVLSDYSCAGSGGFSPLFPLPDGEFIDQSSWPGQAVSIILAHR